MAGRARLRDESPWRTPTAGDDDGSDGAIVGSSATPDQRQKKEAVAVSIDQAPGERRNRAS
jgi:hypothetical protein